MNNWFHDSLYFDDLQFVYVQQAHRYSRKDKMEGSKKFPAYIMGQVLDFHDNELTIVYKEIVGKNIPGIISPKFFQFKKFNVQFGDNYLKNVWLDEDRLLEHERGYSVKVLIRSRR